MTHPYHHRLYLALIAILFSVAGILAPVTVFAEDDTPVTAEAGAVSIPQPVGTEEEGQPLQHEAVSAPPLPALKARLGLPLTYGYHTHTEFPTTTEKWIDVDLSEQRVVAYEGTRPVRAFIVSTGLPGTPTVTGTFRIWIKTPIQDMSGGNRAAGNYYYLKDVKWVQYFYQEYAFHGTYWHNNFGQPMSRGCVNMTNEDAKWLFDWASPHVTATRGWFKPTDKEKGTLVLVHE
jgi:lipoprotein-anchoring transpeptidase ErfK/SrfK